MKHFGASELRDSVKKADDGVSVSLSGSNTKAVTMLLKNHPLH